MNVKEGGKGGGRVERRRERERAVRAAGLVAINAIAKHRTSPDIPRACKMAVAAPALMMLSSNVIIMGFAGSPEELPSNHATYCCGEMVWKPSDASRARWEVKLAEPTE